MQETQEMWVRSQGGEDLGSTGEGGIVEARKGRRPRQGYQLERKNGLRPELWGKAHQEQGRLSQSQMEGETRRGCRRGLGSLLQDQGDGELQASAGTNMG